MSSSSLFANSQPVWVKLSLIQSKSAPTNPIDSKRNFSSRSLTSSSSGANNRGANGWGWLYGYIVSSGSCNDNSDNSNTGLLRKSTTSPLAGSPDISLSCPSPPKILSHHDKQTTTTLRSSPFGQVKLRKTPQSKMYRKSIQSAGNNLHHHNNNSASNGNIDNSNNRLESTQTILINDEWNQIYNNQEFQLTNQEITKNVVLANTFAPSLPSESNSSTHESMQVPKNLIELTHLHEPSLIKSLKERYDQNKVYTLCGKILLALNPFCEIKDLYGKDTMKLYWDNGNSENSALEPHVYACAHEAYTSMRRAFDDLGSTHAQSTKPRNRGRNNDHHFNTAIANEVVIDQSILVSGESGAGKTVTTKIVMQYLASLSEKSSTNGTKLSSSAKITTRSMEQQVLQSNPILESFGNARTIRNDNSSRFGKFIEIQFHRSGCLMGASINTYLLEKVRLIRQAPGERNYHIFYEMLAGLQRRERRELGLDRFTVNDFRITSCTGTFDRRDGVQDEETFGALMHAMKTVGFSDVEQSEILQVTSGLLHMSNLNFFETKTDSVVIDETILSLKHVLRNFGVTFDSLSDALCTCTITVGQEIVKKSLNIEKVEKAMEALMKATYSALFDYIVNRVNNSITVGDQYQAAGSSHETKSTQDHAFIKILDIFGFESFETNSFEQLCINYCNEALQQQFNRYIFKLEQQEYEKENIAWSFISFPDNQDVLDLIEKKHSGIFSILDEQCKLAKCTDASFSRALYLGCEEHTCFESTRTQKARGLFAVNHYAGTVEYDTSSFLNKNKDELPKEATDFLLSSSVLTVRKLGEILSKNNSNDSGNNSNKFYNANSTLSRASVGNQFTAQLQTLRSRIELTSPHYVRCIKTNDELTPDNFVPAVIANQLNCAGVLEAVRVSRLGYPQRYTKDLFVRRYSSLCIKAMERAKLKQGDLCEELVDNLVPQVWAEQHGSIGSEKQQVPRRSSYDLLSVGIQLGKTKVFLRHHAFDALERLRGKKQEHSACKIQSIFRMQYFKRHYQQICSATIILQGSFRSYKARQRLKFLRKSKYATTIQSAWRGFMEYTKYSSILYLTAWCQRRFRGNLARARIKIIISYQQAVVIQSWWRGEQLRNKYNAIQFVARNIQLLYRSKCARAILRGMKKEAKDVSRVTKERDKLKEQIISMKAKEKAMVQAMAEIKKVTEIAHGEKMKKIYTESKQKDEEIAILKDAIKNEFTEEIDSLKAQLNERDNEIIRLKSKVEELERIIMQHGNRSSNPNRTITPSLTATSSLMDFNKNIDTPSTTPQALNDSWSNDSTTLHPQALNFDTAIHTAIRAADSDALSLAITNCEDISDINRRGHDSKSPLHIAVLNSNLESAEFLLQNQSVANTQDSDGNTPLHYAEDSAMVRLLLEVGQANPNIPNESGICAIHIAVRKRDVESVKLMIQHGANVNAADDKKWLTPLHLVAQPFHSDHTSQYCSDINQRTIAIAKLLLETKTPYADVDYQDSDGNTPLHHCAVLSSSYTGDLISLLLKMNASSNIQNNRGQTLLHLVLHNTNLRKFDFYHDLVQLIIYHGSRTDVCSMSGCTPLHLALYHQDTKNAIQLIENGAQLHHPWDKPVRWQAHWLEFCTGSVYAMDMIEDEQTRISLISSINSKQNFAPIRSNCMHCKKKLGAFARPKTCEHCGSMICNSCAPNLLEKSFFPVYCDLQQDEGRVCLICESLLIRRKRDENIMGREVYAIHCRQEDVSFLDMDASHQEAEILRQLEVEM